MNTPAQQVIERYVAIDAHKHYVVIGGLNVQMEIALPCVESASVVSRSGHRSTSSSRMPSGRVRWVEDDGDGTTGQWV